MLVHFGLVGNQDLPANRSEGAVAISRHRTQGKPAVNKLIIQQPGVTQPSRTLEGYRLCLPIHSVNTTPAETYSDVAVLQLHGGSAACQEALSMEVIASVMDGFSDTAKKDSFAAQCAVALAEKGGDI